MVSHGHGRTLVPTVFISVLVSLATLLLGGGTWLAYRSESRDRMEGLRREVATSADQLATSLTLPVWYLDHQQINQILDHLMENAIGQTPAGGTVTLGSQARAMLRHMHEKELMHAAETGERLYLPDKMSWTALQEEGPSYRVYLNFFAFCLQCQ